jgi:hypothetical protein
MKKALGRKQDTLFCMKKKNIRQTNRKKKQKSFVVVDLIKKEREGKRGKRKRERGKRRMNK